MGASCRELIGRRAARRLWTPDAVLMVTAMQRNATQCHNVTFKIDAYSGWCWLLTRFANASAHVRRHCDERGEVLTSKSMQVGGLKRSAACWVVLHLCRHPLNG